MLTDTYAIVLEFIASQPNKRVSLTDINEHFGRDTHSTLSVLLKFKYITTCWFDDDTIIRLCPLGEHALDEYRHSLEEAQQQQADQERQREEDRAYAAQENRKNRHHDYLVAVFEVILGFILGIIAEFKMDIVTFVIQLFEKTISLFR